MVYNPFTRRHSREDGFPFGSSSGRFREFFLPLSQARDLNLQAQCLIYLTGTTNLQLWNLYQVLSKDVKFTLDTSQVSVSDILCTLLWPQTLSY